MHTQKVSINIKIKYTAVDHITANIDFYKTMFIIKLIKMLIYKLM